MKLSKKKENELYEVVSNAVMDARIKIARIENNKDALKVVDDILFRVSIDAPQAAIQLFKSKE